MYKRIVGGLYVLNIIAQAILTLLIPVGLMFLGGWLLVTYCAVPEWIYAVTIPIGVLSGLVSMVRFVIRASEALNRLEAERDKTASKRNNTNGNDNAKNENADL